MESLKSNYFQMNISKDSSPENDKKLNFNFSNPSNNYQFYQEDDEYYLNRLFSFSDEEKEEEKFFPFPFPVFDLEEDKKIENSNVSISSDKDVKMDISNEQEINDNNSNIEKNNKLNSIKDKGEEVMEKISNYISNYQEIIINQTAVKSQNHFDLDANIKLAENTLPGSIISLMKKEGIPLSINYISSKIKDKFLSFRKANGAKYKKDMYIVLKSTLNTSGIFYKAGVSFDGDTYYFKEKESMDFIIKTIERELKKKISKDKKEMSKSISGKKSHKKKKKEKKNKNKNIINELSFNHQLGYKICKLNTILDNMMEKCRGKKNNNYLALNKKFRDEGMEMIKNISEKDKFIGTILCIKFFKGIIEKYIKFKNKKINMEKYLDEKKFHEKILKICEKIEKIEESFNNNGISGDEMSPNLKTINLSKEFDSYNDNNTLYGNKNYKNLYDSFNKL